MARPREFDPETAITAAMHLFWDHGYEDASLAGLLEAMKITKGSFYKAFADKKSIYLKTLDYYDDKVVGRTVRNLMDTDQGSGADRILALFEAVATSARTDGDRSGCFLCNALIDRAAHDAEIEERLQAMVFRLENGFRAALEDRPDRPDPEWVRATARGVLSSYFGLRVLGKAGLSKTMADDCVAQVRRLISPEN